MKLHPIAAGVAAALIVVTGMALANPAVADSAAAVASAASTPALNAAALYNTANGYARANKTGLAVLYYERARLLDPTDTDTDANLGVVRKAAALQAPVPRWYERAASLASPTTVAGLGIAGLLLCAGSLLLLRRSPSNRGWLRATTLLGLIALAFPVLHAASTWPLTHSGVIIAHAAAARVSPVSLGDPAFIVPEGDIVRIASRYQGYVLVRTRAGRSGWLAAQDLVSIIPE